jgi:hypothetical protein
MDTNGILLELRNERSRIDQAIAALAALIGSPTVQRPQLITRKVTLKAKAPVRHITEEGRRRMAEAARQMWIERKRSRHTGNARFMSTAARKRISQAMRARWAAKKSLAKAA